MASKFNDTFTAENSASNDNVVVDTSHPTSSEGAHFPAATGDTVIDTSNLQLSGAPHRSSSNPALVNTLHQFYSVENLPAPCAPLKRLDLFDALFAEGLTPGNSSSREYQNKVEMKILKHLGVEFRQELSDEEDKELGKLCFSFTKKVRALWMSKKVKQWKINMEKETWLQANFNFGTLKPPKVVRAPIKRAPRQVRHFDKLGLKAQQKEAAAVWKQVPKDRENAIVLAAKQILRKKNGNIAADMFDRLVKEKVKHTTIKCFQTIFKLFLHTINYFEHR